MLLLLLLLSLPLPLLLLLLLLFLLLVWGGGFAAKLYPAKGEKLANIHPATSDP